MMTTTQTRSATTEIPGIAALIAFVLCGVVTLVGAMVSEDGWVIGAIGVPGTMFLAWRFAPSVVRQPVWTWRSSLTFAYHVILVTDVIVVITLIVVSVPGYLEFVAAGPSLAWAGDVIVGLGMAIGQFFVYTVLGLLVVGWMAALFVIPLSYLWGWLLRAVTR